MISFLSLLDLRSRIISWVNLMTPAKPFLNKNILFRARLVPYKTLAKKLITLNLILSELFSIVFKTNQNSAWVRYLWTNSLLAEQSVRIIKDCSLSLSGISQFMALFIMKKINQIFEKFL